MKKAVLSLFLFCAAVGIQAQTDRDACWLNAATGAWEWGFFKDFAVHDARQWQYASVKEGRKKTAVTLRSGKETLQLEIRYRNDSVCTIAVNDGKAQTYRLWDSTKGILSYLPADDTPPQPCSYREDSVTLCGYLPGMEHATFTCSMPQLTEYPKFQTQTDSLGRFRLRFPAFGPAQALCRIAGRTFTLLFSPEQDYYLYMNGRTPILMGEDARTSNELLAIGMNLDVFSPTEGDIHSVDNRTCLDEVRHELARRERQLDSLFGKHPNLSRRYRTLKEEEIRYSALHRLAYQHYNLSDFGEKRLSPEIIQAIDSLCHAIPPVPYTIFPDYHGFLQQSVYYQYQQFLGRFAVMIDLEKLQQVLPWQEDLHLPDTLFLDVFSPTEGDIHSVDNRTCLDEVRHELARRERQLDSLFGKHPNLSRRYRTLKEEEIRYSALHRLAYQHYNLSDFGEKRLSPEIIQAIDSLCHAIPPVPYTIFPDYHGFLQQSVYYQYQQFLGRFAVMIDLEKLQQVLPWQEDLHLPDTLLQLIDRTVDMGRKFSRDNPADSTAMQAYDENHFKIAREIHQFPEFREREPRIIGYVDLLRYQELLASSIRTRFQKDLAGTLLAWEALERDHTPFPEPLMRETMAHIQTPVLREAVTRRQNFYGRQLQTPFDYQGSLKSNDIVAGLTDGNEILQRILAPYRGKVVYADIWGGWCGPCKGHMRDFVPAIKEAMKGRDVIFLYLANRTPDDAWRQIIKEYGSVGAQTVHYNLPGTQQEAVEGILLNGGYPSYAIFDKEGRLVTKNAPRPNEKDKLIQTLEEQLNK